MMATWDLVFSHRIERANDELSPYNRRTIQAFGSFRTQMLVLCVLLLALSMLFLFWDLGVPERALYIFLYPHATVLTFGSISLVAELMIGGFLALGSAFHIHALQGRVRRVLNIVCCFTSIATMAYTGVFLMSNIGIAFWGTWTIVLLFVSSSLSCGTALMLLLGYFANEHLLSFRTTRVFEKLHVAFIIVEAISIILFLQAAFANPAAVNACEMLLSPDMLALAIVGVLGFGLIIPIVCAGFMLWQRKDSALPAADAFCLCGGFLLRFCIISCGVY